MKKFIKEYFNYSIKERRGILILIILIVVVFIIPTIINNYSKDTNLDITEFEAQLNRFESNNTIADKKQHTTSIKYFNFDPNTITKSNLLKLGLSNQQAQTLINYRNAGGVFIKPIDLKKIYSIDNKMYEKLYPFIEINKNASNKTTGKPSKLKKTELITASSTKVNNEPIIQVELNTADSIDLIKLNGIGPKLAKRIVSYRNFLGGYYKVEQLHEVYGLKVETYNIIKNSISIDTAFIQKIDLNSIEFKSLNKHPYITYTNTKSILKYRKLMGRFKSKTELLQNHLVDSATYNKIKHYIRY